VISSLAGDVKLEVVTVGDGGPGQPQDESGLTSDEEGEIEDHLRGLGYVE
jgi:hypothetical protein